MSRIAAYRSYAAECLDRAERATDIADRHLFIEMAAGWHELATALANYIEDHHGEEPPVDHFDSLPDGLFPFSAKRLA